MKKRILVVDDMPSVSQSVCILLSMHYGRENIMVANSATDGKSRIANDEPYDLVITDMDMPDGTGVEIAIAAKEKNPGTQVILMSGRMHPQTAKLIEQGLLRGFLEKPMGLCADLIPMAARCFGEMNEIPTQRLPLPGAVQTEPTGELLVAT